MKRRDFQELAALRLKESKLLLQGGFPEGAYYLAGYAAECALKACIAKQTERHEFPDKEKANSIHTHDLEKLLRFAGLREILDKLAESQPEIKINWEIVREWWEQSRYERPSRAEAEDLLQALTHPKHGVFRWLRTTLVGPDIERGEEVLRTLDAADFPITAALWLLQKERGDWNLVIATPLRDKLGAHEAYLRAFAALSAEEPALGHIPIRLESNRRPLIKALRKTFGKADSVKGMRLGLHTIGGVWIDDAYVYRIKK